MADTRGIRAGRAFVELGVSDKLTAGLRAAQKRLKAFGDGLQEFGKKLAGLGAAALTPLLSSVKLFSDQGDALDKMAARTGLSAEALSELGFAAEQSGADMETLEAGIRKMQKSIAEAAQGSASANEALGRLGLSVEKLIDLSPEQQFEVIAEQLRKIKDPTLRAAIAMEVFGKSGTRLLPLVEEGAKGIGELRRQARELGLTVSTQTAKDAALLNDTLNILFRVLKQGLFVIGSALAPAVIELSNAVTRAVVSVTDWIRQNKQLVVLAAKIAVGITAAGLAMIVTGFAITKIAGVFGLLASVASAVSTAIGALGSILAAMLSPIGLVITAVVALGGTLLVVTGAGADALDWLGQQFHALLDEVWKIVGGIVDALAAGDISLAAQILWLSLKLAWQQGVAALNRVWLEAKRFFISTAQSMWFGALTVAEDVFHALEVAWIETTAFLSKAWTNFTSGFQEAWNSAINWTTKRLLELQGLFDNSFDVEGAKKMADEDLAATNAQIEQQRKAAIDAREAQRNGQRDQARDVHDATLREIERQLDAAQQKLDSDTDAKVADTRRALAEARRQLEEALEKAKREREQSEKQGGAPRRQAPDPLAGLEDRLGSIGDLLARKISVVGTFNPVAIPNLGGGDVAERTARASEQTAQHTKRIAEAAVVGGLTFT